MTAARFIIGDTRDVTAAMPDNSVDLVLTSPPFLALRSYLPADHPDKHREIGSEATPADFLDVLLDLTEEWARVLAPHGSIAVELGDTYSASGGSGGDYAEGGLRDGQQAFSGSGRRMRQHNLYAGSNLDGGFHGGGEAGEPVPVAGGAGWPMAKSLCGIPHLFHLSLAYGRNLLRPERTTDPWRVRNVVAWCRPNPPVGALGDKFRPATSYMTIATKSRTRWFDLDAVRGEVSEWTKRYADGYPESTVEKAGQYVNKTAGATSAFLAGKGVKQQGAPPLDWWEIPTEPYKGSHYATWPRDLLTRPIKAMCPLRVCIVCGEPSRRIVEVEGLRGKDFLGVRGDNERGTGLHGARPPMPDITRTTTGWTDCGHNAWRTGVVLDPFAGSGTTLAVATGHGRDAIGIDIDERNADLAIERVGPMFLTVERHGKEAA